MRPPLAPSTPSSRKRKSNQMEVIDLTSSPDPTPKKSASKRRKTEAGESVPSPEKRAKRHRDHPPQSVIVKQQRVMTQRMFLVERSGRKNNALEEEFSVLGSTGNVYVVNVSMIPTFVHLCARLINRCTCPDFLKNQVHCKHILFVFLKVLKLPDPLWYQAAFLTSVSNLRDIDSL